MSIEAFLHSIFQNQWVVGIAGGIISGLLVFLITSKIFSKKENAVYLKSIQSANIEVLAILRPIIAEQTELSTTTLSAIISATARKWNVKINEMMSMQEFGEELIREVMASNFINSQTKNAYSKNIENVFFTVEERVETFQEEKAADSSSFYWGTAAAMMLGVMAAGTSFGTSFLSKIQESRTEIVLESEPEKIFMVIAVLIMPVVAAIVASAMLIFIKTVKHEKKHLQYIKDVTLFDGPFETIYRILKNK